MARMLKTIPAFLVAAAAIAALGGPAPLADDGIPRSPHRLPKVGGEFRVDAALDEEFWKNALALEIIYEVRPGENVPAPVKTEVLLAYNDSHVLAAFRAYDPDPGAIRAHITDRDQMLGDDWVALVFDTFDDKRRQMDFFVNPLGVQADDMECSDCGSGNWDAIWDSAGRITDFGYVVELAIPLSSIRFQRADGPQTWNFDAVRSYPRSVRHHMGLFPRDRSNNCYLCQAERLVGFDGITPGRNLEIAPTFSSLYAQARPGFTEGGLEETARRNDLGLSARWGITPNINLNAAVNPDFSQVEADAAQFDINTNYALQYDEKRPFFTEGAEIFGMRYNVLYTRTFADPDWGTKITGKESGNAVGLYAVQDRKLNLLFPGPYGSGSAALSERNFGTVARYRRDILKNSSAGVIVTDREAEDFYNRVVGVDLNFNFRKTETVRLTALGSDTRYPDAIAAEHGQPEGSFRSGAFDVYYLHGTEGLDWYANYRENGRKFRAHLGYIPMGNWRHAEVGWGHTWNGDATAWYTMFNVGSSFDVETEIDGTPMERAYNYWINYAGPMESTIDIGGTVLSRMYYRSLDFDWNSINLSASLTPAGCLALYFNGRYGSNIDYANEREAVSLRLNPTVEYKAGKHLVFTLDHAVEMLDVDDGRLYTANISQAWIVYQFSKRTFVRSILQYVNYERDPGLYTFAVPGRDERFFSQLLFSFKINPQTVLYLGYSDNYYGSERVELTQTDRTVFAKIGYAWLL